MRLESGFQISLTTRILGDSCLAFKSGTVIASTTWGWIEASQKQRTNIEYVPNARHCAEELIHIF